MSESVRKLLVSVLLFIFLLFFFSHILCLTICHDRYLSPSVCDGDLLIALRTAQPSAGDIVIKEGRAVRYQQESDRKDMQGVVIFLIRRRGF